MFDKSIIENDYFMDLPLWAKALYFLLGMEADDEWFVSPKRVMRIYWWSDDDLKILIMKNFVIQFQSGVVVITDWKENNYLDRNRIKETKYILEKSMLDTKSNKYLLTTDVKPMLNNCSTSIEEKSIEESRIEDVSEEKNLPPPPKEKPTLKNLITEQEFIRVRWIDILQEFINYWCEKDKKGNEKRTKEKTRELDLRLAKWKYNKNTNFWKNKPKDYTNLENFHAMMMQERVPELKEILGKDKYFEIKELRKQSPFYLTR